MIPMAIGITLVLFVVTHIVPVNPLAVILTERSMDDPEAVRAATEKWGLDKPLPVQYLVYLGNLVKATWASPSRPRIRLHMISKPSCQPQSSWRSAHLFLRSFWACHWAFSLQSGRIPL